MIDKLLLKGFSTLNREEKAQRIASFHPNPNQFIEQLAYFRLSDQKLQEQIEEFSENTLSNFILPYGIAPNMMVNQKIFTVPMVIEESSVVAAASHSARFWANHGGFRAKLIDKQKLGQIHFCWAGSLEKLQSLSPRLFSKIRKFCYPITANMEARGGGILDMEIIDKRSEMQDYLQLKISFDTKDSMGANFINSVLEEAAEILKDFLADTELFTEIYPCEIIMAILSNYTPNCKVEVAVECAIHDLKPIAGDLSPHEFARKFKQAVQIAHIDTHRATTHNKGIFNGIDAVVLATANDFRAVEACGHTYAARSGRYRGLGEVSIQDDKFRYAITIPIALGTVGGLTNLHPLAKISLELLDNPNAEELMEIAVSTGLANNFGAIRSLITHGIQLGHMKMHLLNILNSLQANAKEKEEAVEYFKSNKVSVAGVQNFLNKIRASI